jgi:hypothetical protein
MTEAPEHVYRWAVPNCGGYIDYSDLPIVSGNAAKYTRSDIAEAEVKRLEQVVASLEVYIMQMEDKIDSLEKSND